MNGVLLHGVPVWAVAASLPVMLLVAWFYSSVARWLLRGRAELGVSTSIVISMLATSLGLFLASWINPAALLWSPLTIITALATNLAAMSVYAAVAAYLQQPQRATIPELLAAGESDRVEFKSTARVNLHTGAKDERMEQVIAKTIAAFLNADGGTLLIGVDDTGAPLGLTLDFGTLKSPDADRFELWLRDLITTSMGQNAAALVNVEFAELDGADGGKALVCRVGCGGSPRPVYLRPNKASQPEFWVRSGNSTRQLPVDEATEYIGHRWPISLGSSVAAQLRAAVRFSEGR